MSTWPKWAQTIGNASPFLSVTGAPFTDPMAQTANTARFYSQAIPLLNEYVSLVKADLSARGFLYRTLDHQEGTDLFTTGLTWYERAAVERYGITVEYLIQWFAPRDYTPAELASEIERRWYAAANVTMPVAETPAPSVSAPAPVTSSGPGPATTVSTQSTIQPAQTPQSPDSGTIIQPSAPSTELLTFDQWNWKYQQEHGRAGPAPEAVGFPPERRSEPITYQEWESYTKQWFLSQGGSSGGTGGAGGNPPDSASGGPSSYFTIVAALLALLGFSTVAGPQ